MSDIYEVIHGYLWLSMVINSCLWYLLLFMSYLWLFIVMYGYLCYYLWFSIQLFVVVVAIYALAMVIDVWLFTSYDYGYRWLCVVSCGYSWHLWQSMVGILLGGVVECP